VLRLTALTLTALLLLAGIAWLALRGEPPSDEASIRALVEEAARAAEERRVSDVVAPVSERFAGPEGMDRQGVKRLVAAMTLRGAWVMVRVAEQQVVVEGDRATAWAEVVLARGGAGKALADLLPSEATAHRFDLELRREPDGWRVTGARWRPVPLARAVGGAGR